MVVAEQTPAGASLARRRANLLTRRLAELSASGDLWYLVAATVVNVANFGFYGLVGHLLRPASYGAVSALLNVVSIASIPLNALQAAVVRQTVVQSPDRVVPTSRRAGMAFASASLLAGVVLAAASPLLAGFLGISTIVPIILLAVWFIPSVCSSLYDGLLIGTLRWRPISASLIAGAVVRVGLALVIGLAAPGIAGPLLATVLNAVVVLAVVLVALRGERAVPRRPELQLSVRAVLPTMAALTGYSALVAADTVIARHILPATVAGNYAAAVTVGRIALFIPMTITTIVFPRFVAAGGRGPRAQRMLLWSLIAVLALGLAAAGALELGHNLIVTILFGHRYREAGALVGLLSVEGALLGALSLVTYFHLARQSALAAIPAVGTLLAAIVALTLRPGATGLAQLMVCVAGACLLAMCAGAVIDVRGPAGVGAAGAQ